MQPAAGAVATFSIGILGPLAVSRDDTDLDAAKWQQNAVSLLLMLATAPQHRRRKEEVVTGLWPDAAIQSAASNLRYILHVLRQHLNGGGDPYAIVVDHGWIALNSFYHWHIDFERFEELLAGPATSERLLLATSLYRGDPLVEVRYQDWATLVRDRVLRKWRELCLRLARILHDNDNPNAALPWLDRLLEQNPFDEEALREALQTLRDAGRIPEALRRYRRYVAQLRTEIGVAPGESLRMLASELQTPEQNTQKRRFSSVQPVTFIPSYPLQRGMPLVGRRSELKGIRTALVGHQTRLVLLTGEAGVGKTRLLAEVASHARKKDMLTLAGACYEHEGRLPYGPFHDALLDYAQVAPRAALDESIGDLLPEIVRVVPELREHEGSAPEPRYGERTDERLRLYAAVGQVFERLAGQRGIVIILDDLQWTDRASVHLLHYLIRQPAVANVVFVGAYRENEPAASSFLADLLAEVHLNRGMAERVSIIAVEPLGQDGIRNLARSWLGLACSSELAGILWRTSAGNPFFAMQKLTLLHERGCLEPVNEQWYMRSGAEDILPSSLREMISKRLERLGPSEIKVLRIGAVLGRGFTHQALVQVWGSDDDALYDAFDSLLDLKLLRESGEGYAFSQPVIREVIYSLIPQFHQRHLHASAGRALEDIYGERVSQHVTELASHFQRAAMWSRALSYTLAAGDQAQEAFAHDEAIRHYQTALDLTSRAGSESRAEANLRIKLGRLLRITGRMQEAERELRQAADFAESVGEPILQAAAWVGLSKTYMRATNRESMVTALARVENLRPGLAASPPSRELFSLYLELSTAYFSCGKYQDTLELREKARAVAQVLRDERLLVRAEAARTPVLGILGHMRHAGQLALQLIPRAEAVGDIEALRLALAQAAEWAMSAGAFVESHATRQRELATAKRTGATSITPFVLANIAQLCLYMGEWDEASSYAERLLAEEEILSGQPDQAIARLLPLLDRSGHEGHDMLLLLTTLAWARLALDDGANAALDLATTLGRAIAEGNNFALQEAMRIRGLLHANQGDPAEAASDFHESIRLAHQMPYPFAEARTLVDYAGSLRESSLFTEAHDALEQALAIFRRLGAAREIRLTSHALARWKPAHHIASPRLGH